MFVHVDDIIRKLARSVALLGGLVLVTLITITCLSVLGRIGNTIGHSDFLTTYASGIGDLFKILKPIDGDYELVEAGIAFAIFTFIPWCQLNRGHATVELFASMFPIKVNLILGFVWEVVLTLTIFLITWRLYVGMNSKIRNGETTFLLQFPIWWAFAACVVAAVIASLVAVYCVWLRAKDVAAGEELTVATKNEELTMVSGRSGRD